MREGVLQRCANVLGMHPKAGPGQLFEATGVTLFPLVTKLMQETQSARASESGSQIGRRCCKWYFHKSRCSDVSKKIETVIKSDQEAIKNRSIQKQAKLFKGTSDFHLSRQDLSARPSVPALVGRPPVPSPAVALQASPGLKKLGSL